MSLFAAQLFRDIKQVFGDDAEIGFHEKGYLILGAPRPWPDGSRRPRCSARMGADIEVLRPDELRARFPGIDARRHRHRHLRRAGRRLVRCLGAPTSSSVRRRGRAPTTCRRPSTALRYQRRRRDGVRLADGGDLPCDVCVLAAGAWSGRLMATLGIELPVVAQEAHRLRFATPFTTRRLPDALRHLPAVGPPRRRRLHRRHPAARPTTTPTRTATSSPTTRCSKRLFWPAARRAHPGDGALRIDRAWAGHYEVNTLDHNGVVGPHDAIPNLVLCTGFSGHGVMHAPPPGGASPNTSSTGATRASTSSPLGYARIRAGRALTESIVY